MTNSTTALNSSTVVVSFQGRQWRLNPGHVLTIGRSRSCDVRLPDDEHLSRRAGSLRVQPDYVVVSNDSTSKPLVLRPPAGEDRLVEPGAATTSLPYGRFSVVFAGRGGVAIAVDVEARGLRPPRPEFGPMTASARETVTTPISITGTQARVLAALCEPMLTQTGPGAVPATYSEIAKRLSLTPHYVRNVLKTLRETLSGYGIPGLIADDDSRTQEDYRLALARWAVRSGWVTRHDVSRLAPRTGDRA